LKSRTRRVQREKLLVKITLGLNWSRWLIMFKDKYVKLRLYPANALLVSIGLGVPTTSTVKLPSYPGVNPGHNPV
jgi:hypothetical protein